MSISGKIDQAVDRAIEKGCVGTFQIFTCSPRRWNAAPLKDGEADLFREKTSANHFTVFTHMPYLPNMSSPDAHFNSQSVSVLKREIRRCDRLGISYLVLHLGSHMGTSVEMAHKRIIKACTESIEETRNSEVRLLLENSAGTKNSAGSDFSHLKAVLNGIKYKKRIGVCFDTCHAFAAGFDLRTPLAVDKTMKAFEEVVGSENLYLVHLNDSKGELGSAKDRHQNIGEGYIGLEGFKAFVNHKTCRRLPLILETPVLKEGDDKRNLAIVKNLVVP